MAGCGDVTSLESLQIQYKHQIFEAEVITGKSGGVAGGAAIDYSTNQVTGQTQKTMPAILRDLGFEPASFDFTTGGMLTTADRNTAVLWPLASGGDGDWYYWEGALPKVIPAASTPNSTGGVAEGAWRPVGDITLRSDLASTGGAALVVTGNGQNVQEELDSINADVAAITNSNVVFLNPIMASIDDTDRINDITQAGKTVYFTRGVYNVDLDVGILAATGSAIDGAGSMNVVILASQKGASVGQLASYVKGSMFKRVFNPGLANDYVTGVKINNVSFIMRHPASIDGANYRQIAIDMRNIDRSWIGPDVYVGNTTLPGMPFTWEPPRASQAQGYGIVYGTRNSNSIDYCGGVGGVAETPKVYGARKNIVVDDAQISPESAAHATIIRSPDLQIGVELISQGSQYNAGTVFEDCLLQSMQRFESSDVTIGLLMAGYNCRGTIRYLEGGPDCDKIAELTSSSRDCEVDILYASVTGASAGAITDNGVAGSNNNLRYRELTAVSGGKTTKGRFIETFNKGYKSRRVVSTFVNTVGPQTVTGDSGVSVSRSAAGGYNIVLDKQFSGEFGLNVTAKTNPSRQGFSFAYSSKTNNSIHIDTYVNNALLDPEQMTIEIFQV